MTEAATKVTGGCLCGTVRYEAEVYLQSGWFCHCRMCQKTSGAPAEIAVPVKPGTPTVHSDTAEILPLFLVRRAWLLPAMRGADHLSTDFGEVC